jgi:hypothetical protein
MANEKEIQVTTEQFIVEIRSPITKVLEHEYLIERTTQDGRVVQETVRDENGLAVAPKKARELIRGLACTCDANGRAHLGSCPAREPYGSYREA